jgi:hypothetical protein
MKKFFLLFIVTAFAVPLFSQVMPESFLGQIPALPKNICSMSREQIDTYLEKVNNLLQQIDDEKERRDNNTEADNGALQAAAMKNAAAQYGVSQTDMQKLQNPNTSEAEKMAIVNKMSSQKYNISVSEAKSVSNMNEAGKEAWGESIATEQMANAQADPEAMNKDQNKAQKIYNLTMMQKHLNDSLNAILSGFSAEFTGIKDDSEGKKMLDNIDKWNSELMSYSGIASESELKKSEELENKIKAEKEKYCKTFTPRYLVVLSRYESFTKASIEPYYRLEKIGNQLSMLQNGIEVYKEPGGMGIASIESYIDALKDAFQFNLNN